MKNFELQMAIALVIFVVALAEIKEYEMWEEKRRFNGTMTIFHTITFTILNIVNVIMRIVTLAIIFILPLSILL